MSTSSLIQSSLSNMEEKDILKLVHKARAAFSSKLWVLGNHTIITLSKTEIHPKAKAELDPSQIQI